MLATSDMAYDGPALFCIAAILALSLGSCPIRTIHGLANNTGEYHRKPATIVTSAHTSTAHTFTPRKCIESSVHSDVHSESGTELSRPGKATTATACLKGPPVRPQLGGSCNGYRPRVYQIEPGDL